MAEKPLPARTEVENSFEKGAKLFYKNNLPVIIRVLAFGASWHAVSFSTEIAMKGGVSANTAVRILLATTQ